MQLCAIFSFFCYDRNNVLIKQPYVLFSKHCSAFKAIFNNKTPKCWDMPMKMTYSEESSTTLVQKKRHRSAPIGAYTDRHYNNALYRSDRSKQERTIHDLKYIFIAKHPLDVFIPLVYFAGHKRNTHWGDNINDNINHDTTDYWPIKNSSMGIRLR